MKALVSLALLSLLATACSVDNGGSGSPKTIPTITMECTASACNYGTTTTMYSRMYITAYNCNESSIDNSIAASSSENVVCSTTGCNETFGDWVNMTGGSTTTVPSNTYNLCGIVATSDFSGAWAGHVVAVGSLGGVKIDGTTTTTITVSDWNDGTTFPQ